MDTNASNKEIEPPESKADGTQKVEDSSNTIIEVLTPVDAKIGSSPLETAFDLISQRNPRSLGGEVVSCLVAAATKHISYELNEKKMELREIKSEAESMRKMISQQDIIIAVQKSKIASLVQWRNFPYLLLTLGTALLALAIDFFRNNMPEYGFTSAFIGLIIYVGTWRFTPKGGEQ